MKGSRTVGNIVSIVNFAALLLFVGSTANADGSVEVHGITASEFSQPQTWGSAKNVVSVKHLYMSGQIDEESLKVARENGVTAVINMRGPDELKWDEEAATVAAGLDYYNVPVVPGEEGFDADAIKEVTRLVGLYKGDKVLLHCSSGNRVSGWLAIHLVDDHGMELDPAIELAKLANMTKPTTEQGVREFYGEHTDTAIKK